MDAGQTRTTWQTATVVSVTNETGRAKTFRLRLHQPAPHLAGQHYILRLARRTGQADLVRLVVSVRSPDHLYYADELPGPETTVVYTRRKPPGMARPVGRLTATDLPRAIDRAATAYVCGSTGFADRATDLLLDAGIPATAIRVERFGPTGTT